MRYTRWTEEQNQILRSEYPIHGLKLCCERLGLSPKRVKARVEYLGIKRARNSIKVPSGHRYCGVCKKIKLLDNFAKDLQKRRSDCKSCNSTKSLSYYYKNKATIINRIRKWSKTNPILIKKYRQKSYQRNKEKIKTYNQLPHNKIKINLRNRLSYVCRGRKCSTTKNLVGCSWQELRDCLESKFTSGMNWENYGKWHVDHIKPCSSFDLTSPDQQRLCFHYTNLQPLWAIDNLTKGNSI